MAFKRTTKPTFTAPVVVNVPNDKGGFDKNTFTATFRRATQDEIDRLRPMKNADVVREQLVGWDLTDDDTKETVPFTPDELEAILQISPSPAGIAEAFWETISGARAKN